MKKNGLLGVVVVALFCASSAAYAQAIVIFPERQKERQASRWTLGAWMAQKHEIALQNLWLAGHTNKVPVDLTLSAESTNTQSGLDLDLYVAWLGLKAHYEKNTNLFKDSDATAHPRNSTGLVGMQFRLVGGNLQNTNLILRGFYEYNQVNALGARQGPYSGWGFGPELQLYLAEWIGVRGEWNYRLAQPSVTRSVDTQLSGHSWSAVAFLEYTALRLEGGWASREWNFTSASNPALNGDFLVEGLVGRVRIFF